MHYRLVPYVGSGTDDDVFRPAGSQPAEQAGFSWWSIDLRPDPTKRAGWCLLATEHGPLDGVSLPDHPDAAIPARVQRMLADRLGVPITARTLRDLLAELLIDHASEDGSRCRPVKPDHNGRRIIHLGPELTVER